MSGPYDEEPCSVVKFHPAIAGPSGSRALVSQAKAVDGAKTLDEQHPRTRRRREGGTFTQSADETGEIRLGTGVNIAGRRPAVSGNGETYKQSPCEVVERRAEVGGGRSSEEGWDNRTRLSEGPPARYAHRLVRGSAGLPLGLSTRHAFPEIRHGRLGRPPTSWRCGMRASDCLGESRMRENLTSGSGRGRWKRAWCSMVTGDERRVRKRPGCAPAGPRISWRTAPAPYFTRLPSLVSKDRSYKPVVKSSGGKRKSGGVVVLLIVGSNPRGGKGPDFGHAGDRARCEDMAGTARSNSPSGPMPVVSARGLCQRLWARAKESSRPRCAGLDPRCADLAPGASVTDVGEAA